MTAKKLKELSPAQYAFMTWLYQNHPNLARDAEQHNKSLSGFMDSLTNVFNSVMEKAPDLMNQYVAGKTQIEQLKANLARAAQGQYPLNADGTVYSPGTTAMLQRPLATVSPLVWIAGAGILLAVVLMVRK